MTFFDAAILGIVEGATEFIPVSSSGHLIIVRNLLGIGGDATGLAFDAIVQSATILAVAFYFRHDLWNVFISFLKLCLGRVVSDKEKTLVYAIVLGTIPAVIFGLLLEKKMETVFRDIHLVAVTLLMGSLLMYCAEKYAKKGFLTLKKGIGIGLFQCLALIPGVSRSGATISGGLLLGLDREEATRFSFLLSFPVIVGAGLKKLFDLVRAGGFEHILGGEIWLASVIAFFVGLVSIHFLVKYLRTHTLNIFIWYRIILACGILATFFFNIN